MSSALCVFYIAIYSGDQMKAQEKGWACSRPEGEDERTHNFNWTTWKEKMFWKIRAYEYEVYIYKT
jgi:hypothetical protein